MSYCHSIYNFIPCEQVEEMEGTHFFHVKIFTDTSYFRLTVEIVFVREIYWHCQNFKRKTPSHSGDIKNCRSGRMSMYAHSFMDKGLSEERASCNSLELMKWIRIFHGRIF